MPDPRSGAPLRPCRLINSLIFFTPGLALSHMRVYIICIMQFSGRGEIVSFDQFPTGGKVRDSLSRGTDMV